MVSFVITLLIWVGNQALTIYLSFLIVLPLIYTNTLAGFLNVDPEMLEMAETFRLSRWKKFLYIYRPSFMPFLISSCRVALVCEGKVDEKQLAEELSQILPPNSLHQPISQLSGGMKRRVALARAMHYPCRMIVLDEPLSGSTRTRGSSFGEAVAFGAQRSWVEIRTLTPTRVLFLPAERILDHGGDPDVVRVMANLLMEISALNRELSRMKEEGVIEMDGRAVRILKAGE